MPIIVVKRDLFMYIVIFENMIQLNNRVIFDTIKAKDNHYPL